MHGAAQTSGKVVERLRRRCGFVGPFFDSPAVVGHAVSANDPLATKLGYADRRGSVVVLLPFDSADDFGPETAVAGRSPATS